MRVDRLVYTDVKPVLNPGPPVAKEVVDKKVKVEVKPVAPVGTMRELFEPARVELAAALLAGVSRELTGAVPEAVGPVVSVKLRLPPVYEGFGGPFKLLVEDTDALPEGTGLPLGTGTPVPVETMVVFPAEVET
jgi:hypothetical protein